MSGEEAKVIYDKLNTMDTKLDEIVTWKEVHLEAHKQIGTFLGDCRKTLYGGDEMGLEGKVNLLWQRGSFINYVLRIVIAAVVIALLTFVLKTYKVV